MQKRKHGSVRSRRRNLTVCAAVLAVVGGVGVFGVNIASADETDGQPAPQECDFNSLPGANTFGGEGPGSAVFADGFGCDPAMARDRATGAASRQCTGVNANLVEDSVVNAFQQGTIHLAKVQGRCA